MVSAQSKLPASGLWGDTEVVLAARSRCGPGGHQESAPGPWIPAAEGQGEKVAADPQATQGM